MPIKKDISLFQLSLISTGGMIGCGWLFSPYYGYQVAGVGVILSWLITAFMTFVIGISFAKISYKIPIVGGISRLVGITHNKSLAFVFLSISWLSYVVYLPMEAQSVVQYLGFWMHFLVVTSHNHSTLSFLGVMLAIAIIFAITWFNTTIITKVANVNIIVSIWKIAIPLFIALILIITNGHFSNVFNSINLEKVNMQNIFFAIINCGLVFAFSGFQNGLILANHVKNPEKSLAFSLFLPIIVGSIIYILLSLCYLFCLNKEMQVAINTVAPLLGLVSLFSLNVLFIILFADAIIAPLGTTNVYVAVTSRILYALGKDFLPNSILVKINNNDVPTNCLWINAFISILFLLPFPTWQELVALLSSMIIMSYLGGPIVLMALDDYGNDFRNKYNKLIGYGAFVCCSLLLYWSGYSNLCFLNIVILLLFLLIVIKKSFRIISMAGIYFILYFLILLIMSKFNTMKFLIFPFDILLISSIGMLFCYLFIHSKLTNVEISVNLQKK